ncbi:ABC transporter ATP-binding protein [Citricoccus sp. GCM10030269]|uniref:ABC transporter ATP-binding protein n=1 Tax=Citricoccus sp. GCM10030269 TaxID=3273388 RepID=UPI00361DF2E0
MNAITPAPPASSGTSTSTPLNSSGSDPDPGTALHASGVHRHFGSGASTVRAVDGVDLTIRRGEIVALLGPNGAGKTTFLDMILGFASPTSGSLTVLGSSPKQAVHDGGVGAVLQTGGLLSDLTVKETVSMVAACQFRHISVASALERAGATGIASRKVRKCSGGEQQRLRFALALLTDPELLLLDEPTAGMDVRARKEFWETMHAEAERGRTVIFATHFLQEASDFADRIVLMRSGRIALDGPVEEVTNTGHRTLSCLWDGPGTPQEVAQKLGLPDAVVHQNGRVRFTVEDTDSLARFLLSAELAHDLTITAASLDDVFLDLTADAAESTGTAASTGTSTSERTLS